MNKDIEIKFINKNKGRGVFACRDFSEGDIVEECPVFEFNPDSAKIDSSWHEEWYDDEHWEKIIKMLDHLGCYTFNDAKILLLGYGSLYNHSDNANIDTGDYESEEKENPFATFKALRYIKAGEELCIKYGWDKEDLEKLKEN